MSHDTAHLTVRGADDRDDELFTTPSTDPAPDRHPSVLRPGGHASPLKYPAALRPGAGRRSRTPSPGAPAQASPGQHPVVSSTTPVVSYKAYSPPRPQSPSDELSAEIEGYFTALEVPPLNINKPKTPEPSAPASAPYPADDHLGGGSLEERCASPPVPPKETISVGEDHHVVSPVSELEAPTGAADDDHNPVSPVSESHTHHEEAGESAEPPPAYEESQHVPPPPEKGPPPRTTSTDGLAGSSVASASQVGSAVIGISTNDAIESSSELLEAAAKDDPAATAEGSQDGESAQQAAAVPPPLPPRPSPSPSGKGKEPEMPGAFPPPPVRPYKASGAAATSAASVGASVAGVGQSSGLQHARKALEKGLGHLIDKAKEHHQAREHRGHERKPSDRKKSPDGAKKRAVSPAHTAQVSPNDDTILGLRWEAEQSFV